MRNDSIKSVAFGRFQGGVPSRFLVHGVADQEIPDSILKILCNLTRDRNVWYVNTKDNILYDCRINSCGEFNIDYITISRCEKTERLNSVFTIIVPKQ